MTAHGAAVNYSHIDDSLPSLRRSRFRNDWRPALSTRRILIVDDDPQIQKVLAELLRRAGFVPEAATTIAQAIAEAERQHVDAVVLDVTLSEVGSGIDLLAWFRGQLQYEATPMLILTGLRSLPEDEEALIRRHGAYVFYKPESLTELVTYLNRLV